MSDSRGFWRTGVIVVLSVLLVVSSGGVEADDGAIPVSLVRLLAAPDDFSGKRVEVIGFLQKKPTLHLFLTRDHAISLDIQSSVIVSDDSSDGSLTQSDCMDHYVRVTGRFDRLMGVAWAIVGSEDVMRMDTIENCWQRR